MASSSPSNQEHKPEAMSNNSQTRLFFGLKPPSFLIILNSAMMLLGSGGPLLLRVYFKHGGTRLWFSSFIQLSGWPLVLIPIALYYLTHPQTDRNERRHLSPFLTVASAFLGILSASNSYLYSYGSSYLPLSTSSLIMSTQLAFTAVFAFFIVKQRFSAFSVNSVVLLTLGPVVLSLGMGSDRPAGETTGKYVLGFLMTVSAAALLGLLMPLVELVYRKTKVRVTYGVVMEIQLVMGIFGCLFCLVGMIFSKDFQAISKEAKEFGLGERKYYMVLIWDAFFWQMLNLGIVGIIACASSLVGGIGTAILLSLGELLGVIFLREKFNGSKAVCFILTLWGFASYLYGEKVQNQKMKHSNEVQLSTISEP